MTYLERGKDIYKMISEGKLLDAFEKYYSENVVMQELGEQPRIGKAANREFEQSFVNSIKEVHSLGISSIGSNEAEGMVYIENWFDATYKNDVRVIVKQVSVQKWEGDFIVFEKFYHNNYPNNNEPVDVSKL
ncbi:MAG: nuclear transport factor 2 family protein [Bacteroidia bacterium]|nr:nuclear transport factor 2 family protein [Bacteroidia bacterium]